MAENGSRRRHSLVGPIILIALGALLLLSNFYPDIAFWPILARYWPLILIFLGLGKLWDYYWGGRQTEQGMERGVSGVAIALAILLALFIVAVVHGGRHGARRDTGAWWGWRGNEWGRWGPYYGNELHDTKAVELQGAKSVSAHIEMPAGELDLSGGSSRLLDADFHYDPYEGTPWVHYTVVGNQGQLYVEQGGGQVGHFGHTHNDWSLRLGGDVPLDLKLEMGAGRNTLRLDGLNVERLELQMGAGEMNLYLAGLRAKHFEGTIEGGAGQARIHLPKDIGTRIHASGGIGAIKAPGLLRDGDAYVNEAYGKTAATIELNVSGGVGEIDLIQEQ